MRHILCALDKIRDILFVSSCEATLKISTFYRTGKQTSPRLDPRFWSILKKEKWIPYVLMSFFHRNKQSNRSSYQEFRNRESLKGIKIRLTTTTQELWSQLAWREGRDSFQFHASLSIDAFLLRRFQLLHGEAQSAALFIYFSHVPSGLKFHEARAVTLFQFWCDQWKTAESCSSYWIWN